MLQKKSCIVCTFVMLASLLGNAQSYGQLSFPDFSSTAGLQLNGNAIQNGNDLRLAAAVNDQEGSAFSNNTVGITAFSTFFTFRLTNPSGCCDVSDDAGADGITFDHEGRLFVAANGTEVIAVISEDGEDVAVLAEDELLDFPANVRFGRGDHEDTLYIANFAFLRFAGIVEGDPNPALLTLEVDDDD